MKKFFKKFFKWSWVAIKVIWIIWVTYATMVSFGFSILHEIRFQSMMNQEGSVKVQTIVPYTRKI